MLLGLNSTQCLVYSHLLFNITLLPVADIRADVHQVHAESCVYLAPQLSGPLPALSRASGVAGHHLAPSIRPLAWKTRQYRHLVLLIIGILGTRRLHRPLASPVPAYVWHVKRSSRLLTMRPLLDIFRFTNRLQPMQAFVIVFSISLGTTQGRRVFTCNSETLSRLPLRLPDAQNTANLIRDQNTTLAVHNPAMLMHQSDSKSPPRAATANVLA